MDAQVEKAWLDTAAVNTRADCRRCGKTVGGSPYHPLRKLQQLHAQNCKRAAFDAPYLVPLGDALPWLQRVHRVRVSVTEEDKE